ncbi:hypothetical protein KIW84_061966 [Lathyrus oleraceus]|uniref:Reverse transcriptase domain-containing protein n=1 Tax=Pisum sativum TaxID=3888 RepID=A0A9D5A5V3_PEA|nr:hypothetical protein KIW84_061966 [Pisum sativum]
MSTLINGSPTKDFVVGRGLRQGYPLSPFLHAITTEGLDGMKKREVQHGDIKGFKTNVPNFPHSVDVPMQYMEQYGSSVPHSSPMQYVHDEQDAEDDHGDTSAHKERMRAHMLRNPLQIIRKHLARFIIESEGGS